MGDRRDAAGLAPVRGVSLRQYAEIVRAAADLGFEQAVPAELAEARGIDPADWLVAAEGWNLRMRHDPAVGRAYHGYFAAEDP